VPHCRAALLNRAALEGSSGDSGGGSGDISRTPLGLACAQGKWRTVEVLLAAGAGQVWSTGVDLDGDASAQLEGLVRDTLARQHYHTAARLVASGLLRSRDNNGPASVERWLPRGAVPPETIEWALRAASSRAQGEAPAGRAASAASPTASAGGGGSHGSEGQEYLRRAVEGSMVELVAQLLKQGVRPIADSPRAPPSAPPPPPPSRRPPSAPVATLGDLLLACADKDATKEEATSDAHAASVASLLLDAARADHDTRAVKRPGVATKADKEAEEALEWSMVVAAVSGRAVVAAAGRGNAALLRVLLAHGGTRAAQHGAESGANGGTTALLAACGGRHLKCVEALLEAGADVNRASFGGAGSFTATTPLEASCARNHCRAVGLLLVAGARVEPGLLVSCCSRGRPEILDMLLTHAAATPGLGTAPGTRLAASFGLALVAAARAPPPEELVSKASTAVEAAKAECVAVLVRHGADPNAACAAACGGAALHAAAARRGDGGGAVAVALLKAGADPDSRDAFGRRAVHLAAGSLSVSVCRLLLSFGANARAPDAAGRSPAAYCRPGALEEADAGTEASDEKATVGTSKAQVDVAATATATVEEAAADATADAEAAVEAALAAAALEGRVKASRWPEAVLALNGMGFEDLAANDRALAAHRGDLVAAIDALTTRAATASADKRSKRKSGAEGKAGSGATSDEAAAEAAAALAWSGLRSELEDPARELLMAAARLPPYGTEALQCAGVVAACAGCQGFADGRACVDLHDGDGWTPLLEAVVGAVAAGKGRGALPPLALALARVGADLSHVATKDARPGVPTGLSALALARTLLGDAAALELADAGELDASQLEEAIGTEVLLADGVNGSKESPRLLPKLLPTPPSHVVRCKDGALALPDGSAAAAWVEANLPPAVAGAFSVAALEAALAAEGLKS